jgi:hypothetical protein
MQSVYIPYIPEVSEVRKGQTLKCTGPLTLKSQKKKKKLHGLSPRATAASRRSDCQLLRIEGAAWSA